MDVEQIKRERKKRVAVIEARDGLRDEATYKVTEGDKVRWYKVWIVFYPKAKWLITEINDVVAGIRIGPIQVLTDELKSKLETWL